MMKGGGGSVGKRRWRGLVIAILGLVILSMLVPLGFLFGRFHSASTAVFVSDQQSSQSNGFWSFDRQGTGNDRDQSESMKHQSEADHVKELVEKFAPTISKDVLGNNPPGAKNQNIGAAFEDNQPEKVFPVPLPGLLQSVSSSNVSRVGQPVKTTRPNKAPISDNDKSCEVTFGSYCLWRREHKEAIKDAMVKKLKDSLFVARAYYPSIAKLPDQEKLSRELRLNIQEFERIPSESSRDADLPPQQVVGHVLSSVGSSSSLCSVWRSRPAIAPP